MACGSCGKNKLAAANKAKTARVNAETGIVTINGQQYRLKTSKINVSKPKESGSGGGTSGG